MTAVAENDMWAMGFVHDQLFDGTKVRALTIVDTLSRASPVIDVRQSYRGHYLVDRLEHGAAEFGCAFYGARTERAEHGANS